MRFLIAKFIIYEMAALVVCSDYIIVCIDLKSPLLNSCFFILKSRFFLLIVAIIHNLMCSYRRSSRLTSSECKRMGFFKNLDYIATLLTFESVTLLFLLCKHSIG